MAHPFAHDPVLRLLPSETPASFLSLDEKQQAARGRYFLMAWVLHGQNIPYAWWAALNEKAATIEELVRDVDDALIIEAVKIANEEMAAPEHVTQQ